MLKDENDLTTGIVLTKKVSDRVEQGETIAYVNANNENKLIKACEKIQDIIKIAQKEVEKEKTILEIIK